MLKYRSASSFGGWYPLPLTALQIPADALKDDNVDKLSLRFRNSGYAFILSHELGHLYHRHEGSTIRNEEEADLFALKIMQQKPPTIPMGIVLWFLATAYYFQNRGNFASERKWEEFLRNEMTHPLNEQRLRTLAERLNEYAADFTQIVNSAADKEIIRFIANGILNEIVPVLEEVEIQHGLTAKARSLRVSSLAPRSQTQPYRKP